MPKSTRRLKRTSPQPTARELKQAQDAQTKNKQLASGNNDNAATLYHRPYSADDALMLELSDSLDSFHLGKSFLGFVPSRIGHSQAIDHASIAVIGAHKYFIGGDVRLQTNALRHYAQAVTALRIDLAKNNGGPDRSLHDAMLTAALLFCFETTLDPKVASGSAHNRGLSAIILASSGRSCMKDELPRSLLYFHWKGVFNRPVVLGQVSPFDNEYWLGMRPASCGRVGKEVETLRWLAQKLFVRLPRLIALVREAKMGGGASVDEAMKLAEVLAVDRDDKAENVVLHGLKVAKTQAQTMNETKIIPFSYEFEDTPQYEGAMYYWQTRIMANRLLALLLSLSGDETTTTRIQSLQDENVRLVMNQMMSFQYGLSVGLVGAWAICLGWITVWGAVQDVECIQRGSRTLWSERLRPFLLQKYNLLHRLHVAFGETDMDEAAEMLVGGPLGARAITGVMP
ncbi:uncharacterized protein LTR77_009583 [Saxophila tyrrhenica]|uniref:Uncharacterized protein n=1 Tax=Saxophila tyrrhenica TaxID=1690608 RepID=A0AAV9NZ09_9PEZI|nr:hypothetical protein LTR77_009583 [Saxophila tyrrhenica]